MSPPGHSRENRFFRALRLDCLTVREIAVFGVLLLAVAWGLIGSSRGPLSPVSVSGLYDSLRRACPDFRHRLIAYPYKEEVVKVIESFPLPAKGIILETVPLRNVLLPVNINKATIPQLCRLPGIGPKIAKEIIEYRRRRPFTRPEDLIEIRGIGEKRVAAIKDLVSFY